MSAIDAKFGHVNVTTPDWRRLAAFYTDVFGCVFVPPERDIRSADLDAGTGLHDAHLTGAHLRLPGHGDSGPTIEIFEYEQLDGHPGTKIDRPGWGHVAFQVPDVPAAVDAVVAAGGGRFGEIVAMQTKDGRHITWVYATDPDGNIVELQAWSRATTWPIGRAARPVASRPADVAAMTVDADLERLADIRALVRDVALSSDAPPACLDDLIQAVDEAATNIVLHGYERRGGAIDVDARLVDDHIVIVLSDTAPTFDPTTVPEPDLSVPALRRRPGGMGIHLIRLATDSIAHRPRPGGGNILTLTRSLDPRPKEER